MRKSYLPPKWEENIEGAKEQLRVIREKADKGDVTEEVRKLNSFLNPDILTRLVIQPETGREELEKLLITEHYSKARELLASHEKETSRCFLDGKDTPRCFLGANASLEAFLERYDESLERMGTSEKELGHLLRKGKYHETLKVK